jgi:acylphosphatase
MSMVTPARWSLHPSGSITVMKIARRFVVTGLVQGVGFRWYTRDAARREGVTGYVRNLPDGSVEAFAEGDSDAVTRLERAIRRGPAGARVRSVDVSDEPAGGAFKSFAIT